MTWLFPLALAALANLLPLPFPPLSPTLGLPAVSVTAQPEDLPSADSFDSLAWRIAARATGEADVVGVVGVEGVWLVACTMVNRLAGEQTPERLDGVLRAYYAADDVPTAEYVALAEKALSGGCPAVLYAFSGPDTVRLGFERATADFVVARGGWAIYFWARWPE